jgi:phage shock protein A
MAYRDQDAAARAHLAALEQELIERRVSRIALTRYRDALRDEWARLAHAAIWYENGERYGFNRFAVRDDLSPAAPPALGLPSVANIAEHLATIEAERLQQRAEQVQRALGRADPGLERLRSEVEELRVRCAALRARVEAYAARWPDHPPPPEYKPGTALAILGASCGSLLALLAFLAALAMRAALSN